VKSLMAIPFKEKDRQIYNVFGLNASKTLLSVMAVNHTA
jgi:hypothetical protein